MLGTFEQMGSLEILSRGVNIEHLKNYTLVKFRNMLGISVVSMELYRLFFRMYDIYSLSRKKNKIGQMLFEENYSLCSPPGSHVLAILFWRAGLCAL